MLDEDPATIRPEYLEELSSRARLGILAYPLCGGMRR